MLFPTYPHEKIESATWVCQRQSQRLWASKTVIFHEMTLFSFFARLLGMFGYGSFFQGRSSSIPEANTYNNMCVNSDFLRYPPAPFQRGHQAAMDFLDPTSEFLFYDFTSWCFRMHIRCVMLEDSCHGYWFRAPECNPLPPPTYMLSTLRSLQKLLKMPKFQACLHGTESPKHIPKDTNKYEQWNLESRVLYFCEELFFALRSDR